MVKAYVNHDRWVIDCDGCRTGHLVNGPGTVPCSCGYRLEVEWPDNAALIEAALSVRPLEVNRNWYPHETIEDLMNENRLHMGLI